MSDPTVFSYPPSSASASAATAEVEVSSRATAGAGTVGSPWTGWDTAITWAAFTRYRFKSGYYSYATSPNYGLSGIELVGEPGTYFVHTGTGNGFVMDAGATVGGTWIQNVRVENICVTGSPAALTGTLSVTSGAAAVTGSGTAFLTQVAVGDSITFAFGASTARSYIVSAVADDTHLTIDRNATLAETTQLAKVTKTQNGFYLRGMRNGAFDRLSVRDVAAAGIRTEACVTNSLRLFRCTFHEPAQNTYFQCRPQYGIVTAGRGADWSTCWSTEEPVIEGVQIYGIWFKADSYGNTVTNGTSESNPTPAVDVQLDGNYNTLTNIDVEGNGAGTNIVVASNGNTLLNVFSSQLVTTSGSVSGNKFIGGRYQSLTLASGSSRCFVNAGLINGTFTDSGSGNYYFDRSSTDLRSQVGIIQPVITSNGTGAANAVVTNYVAVNLAGDITVPAPTNPTNGMEITYRFDNNSGSSRTLGWNAIFQSLTGATLITTVVHTGTAFVRVRYSSFWTKWQCVEAVGG